MRTFSAITNKYTGMIVLFLNYFGENPGMSKFQPSRWSGQRNVLIFNLIGSQYNAEDFQKGLNLKRTILVWNFPVLVSATKYFLELVSATKYKNDCIGS